ncbi:MAG: hypothetical protein ABIN97_04115 [Ginsengibacter sp.]
MKYNLDDLHWQEFEVLSFKILQILIAKDVQFLEGGNDKGRDVVYNGSSDFNNSYSGQWIFQVKHKSKLNEESEIASTLLHDLKYELKKVFVTNGLKFDNYVLVTNKTISGTLFDHLNEGFLEFKKDHQIECSNFSIISYRHIESCIDNNDVLKWSYPNIINHPDFLLLLKGAINYNLENRRRGWLNGLNKLREKFVYTQFYQKAYDKLSEYPAIILSGPPKSGKTFNAEILALNFSIFENYQPVLIDSPEEIESSFEYDRKQIFICDDAFGKYGLSYKAEEWFIKLERVFNLADKSHLFIFTSREYVFRAFVNFDNESAKSFLEKILVESHNYSSQEKLAILKRYTIKSNISEYDKDSIIHNEVIVTNHKNFSPETIRAFFSNINEGRKNEQLNELKAHLDKPDSYLSTVFFKLSNIKQAALLAILCSIKNNERSIYEIFDLICQDLNISTLLNSALEFDELDDSILRILRSDVIEEINFYHPSMQEFLTRQLIANESGKLREVVLKNLNIDLLGLSMMKSSAKFILHSPSDDKIKLQNKDIGKIQIGLTRLVNNSEVTLYQVASIFKWFKSPDHTIELKMSDMPFFKAAKEIVAQLASDISNDNFYCSHKNENISTWSYLFFMIKNTLTFYSIDINKHSFHYIDKILTEKKYEKNYWMVVFRILSFTDDDFIHKTVGRDWLNIFYKGLKNDMYDLGREIFGKDFPDFKEYNENKLKNLISEKVKQKPNRSWYPRFLLVKERIDILKEIKGSGIGNTILEKLSKPYEELIKQSGFAKNRHGFNLKQGWWKD